MIDFIFAGVEALKEYVAYHILTCLVPAFLLAGCIVTFVSKDVILRFLGPNAKKIVAYPFAIVSGILLAVCSCTVIPISAGIYKKGSGIGPAFILLWVAPASNILAIVYTGAILGYDMAAVRVVAAIVTASIIGLAMALTFRREERSRGESTKPANISYGEKTKLISGKDVGLILLLVIALLLPNYLVSKGPYLNKIYIFLVCISIAAIYAYIVKSKDELKNWLGETGWFVKIIVPLLLIGVFVIGIVGKILQREWIESWLGGNTLSASFLATLIGALSYFATLTEAPFVSTLLGLGMGKGPALALLLAGPGISLPSMLAIWRMYSAKKTLFYICLVIMIGTFAGFIAGNTIWR